MIVLLPKKYTSRIVLQNSELTAKYQHPLVQIGQKIPEGLDLQMGVPVQNKLSVCDRAEDVKCRSRLNRKRKRIGHL